LPRGIAESKRGRLMDRLGLLFPGQGAQKVGMGADLAEAYSSAREVFEEANEATGLALDRLCFHGPLTELSRSDVAQPAILAVSIATLRAMAEAGGTPPAPAAVAGLSLGEYSALVAAGALEFGDALRLVRQRGAFMQEACEVNPGAMYSVIGLADPRVEEACERAREQTGGGVWPANYNCPGQLVISGEEEPTRRAAELCSEMGARRALRLTVAGAFHTPLMQPAADRLAPVLSEVEIAPPAVPVVANVTGRPTLDPEELRRRLLEQITSPVRWADGVRWMLSKGLRRHYEVGPGRVLQGLLRRTDAEAECVSINDAEDVRAFAETMQSEQPSERNSP
jgi:[acyl-carrier-protein] S-malonyltransferase